MIFNTLPVAVFLSCSTCLICAQDCPVSNSTIYDAICAADNEIPNIAEYTFYRLTHPKGSSKFLMTLNDDISQDIFVSPENGILPTAANYHVVHHAGPSSSWEVDLNHLHKQGETVGNHKYRNFFPQQDYEHLINDVELVDLTTKVRTADNFAKADYPLNTESRLNQALSKLTLNDWVKTKQRSAQADNTLDTTSPPSTVLIGIRATQSKFVTQGFGFQPPMWTVGSYPYEYPPSFSADIDDDDIGNEQYFPMGTIAILFSIVAAGSAMADAARVSGGYTDEPSKPNPKRNNDEENVKSRAANQASVEVEPLRASAETVTTESSTRETPGNPNENTQSTTVVGTTGGGGGLNANKPPSRPTSAPRATVISADYKPANGGVFYTMSETPVYYSQHQRCCTLTNSSDSNGYWHPPLTWWHPPLTWEDNPISSSSEMVLSSPTPTPADDIPPPIDP